MKMQADLQPGIAAPARPRQLTVPHLLPMPIVPERARPNPDTPAKAGVHA